jgi:hypothetical protein
VSVGSAAELCSFVDDAGATALLHGLLEPYASRILTLQDSLICMGSVARPLGALSARLGRWEQAEACFVRARAHARDLRAPVLQALADTDWALALRLHSDARERRRGEALRHGVVERARELGLGGLIERLES